MRNLFFHNFLSGRNNLSELRPGLIQYPVEGKYCSQQQEAADVIVAALTKTIQQKKVTYDLARQLENAKELSTSEFGRAIVENMGENA